MMKRVRLILSILIIAALASAGISPACAFVSGKVNLIEICTEDGTIKTIAVTDDQAPQPKHDHAHKNADCAFCFSNAHAHGFISAAVVHQPLIDGYLKTGSGSAAPVTLSLKSFESTGPPAIFLS
jgi:hypothetical protein